MALAEINGFACLECRAPAAELHHVIPRSRGGIKTVPLCGSCHDLVHDRDGNRSDSAGALIAEGRSGQPAHRPAAQRSVSSRHQRVMRALRPPTGIRLAEPPTLVRDREMDGHAYEEWRPWIAWTTEAETQLATEMQAINWGY